MHLQRASIELPVPVPGYTKAPAYGPIPRLVADIVRGKSFSIQVGAKLRHCRFIDPTSNIAPTLMENTVAMVEHQGETYLLGPSDRERRQIVAFAVFGVLPAVVMGFGVSGGFSVDPAAGVPWGPLLVAALVFVAGIVWVLAARRGFWRRLVERVLAHAIRAHETSAHETSAHETSAQASER